MFWTFSGFCMDTQAAMLAQKKVLWKGMCISVIKSPNFTFSLHPFLQNLTCLKPKPVQSAA